jgi:hypothetical protein
MKVCVCLLALCSLVFHSSATYGQTPKKDDRSAEWEYKQLGSPSDDLLNHYAKNGWEIGAAAGGANEYSIFYNVILKRSKSHPLFGTQTPAFLTPPPLPLPQKSRCKMTLAQAPAIRGLRLGMTSDELFAIFPADEHEQSDRAQQLKSADLHPHYGYASFQFAPSRYATRDRFTGVSSLNFGLFDRKVVYICATYSNMPILDRMGQVMEIITRQFGLPEFKAWPGYSESWELYNSPSLSCEGFTFQAHGGGGFIFITLTDLSYKKIADERKRTNLAKNLGELKL